MDKHSPWSILMDVLVGAIGGFSLGALCTLSAIRLKELKEVERTGKSQLEKTCEGEIDLGQPTYLARKIFKDYASYPQYMQLALTSGCYKGDLLADSEIQKAVNSGRYEEAVKCLLEQQHVKLAMERGDQDAMTRIGRIAGAFRKYASELEAVDENKEINLYK